MASTQAAQTLTEQHRRAQLQLRARALRDFAQLWPIWEGDEDTFLAFAIAAVTLVRAYRGLSADLAAAYYRTFRAAEGARGEAAIRRAAPIVEERLIAELAVEAQDVLQDALSRGLGPERAKERVFVASSGTISDRVQEGGRETILRTVEDDESALGWARVTDASPCAFCAMLAARGPIYKKKATASFTPHHHCGCTVEPVFFRDAAWPGRAREFRAMYAAAIREAQEAGELRRGTSNDLLNAFRRYYERTVPSGGQ